MRKTVGLGQTHKPITIADATRQKMLTDSDEESRLFLTPNLPPSERLYHRLERVRRTNRES